MEPSTPEQARYGHLIRDGYEFRFGDYINRGLEIFKADMWNFVGFSATLLALVGIPIGLFIATESPVAAIGMVVIPFVMLPLVAGFYIFANKVANDEPRTFQDFFAGFSQMGSLLGLVLLMGFAIIIGMILFFFPGIYLAVGYGFALPLVVLGGMSPWQAMETSRKVIHKNWWWFLLFGIVVGFISSIGQYLLLIGWFFTMPIAYCIQYAAFEDIMGESQNSMASKIDTIGADDESNPFDTPAS